ncbi:YcxB-like protein [Chryseobacterium soldanellicola]|uniref:YcxB-like protein n=1 Tax=Chryseobacterium soldanellicola TaxID=311333 RepID=A0A1H1CWW4_9FLAO|nr:YcxB family protein [Chryseobacterium soldanellicola]SDQ68745.1 YcxB-like protein [Chryseobacterium soldanellicola]
MIVKTQITFKDFLLFHLKNSLVRIIVFPIIALIFFGVNYYNADNDNREFLESLTIWLLILFVFIIIRTYFTVKKVFYSNKQIQESIVYTFTNENIQIKGETFDGEFTWNTVYKVKEKKDWFLIYQNAQVMNMVPKQYFAKDQILELRSIIKNKGVKAKLRND